MLPRCTLHPNDQLALEGPLSRVKSLKKSLRQSFRRIRRSRVSSRKQRPAGPPGEVRPSEAERGRARPAVSPSRARGGGGGGSRTTSPPPPPSLLWLRAQTLGAPRRFTSCPAAHQLCGSDVSLLPCASASPAVKGSNRNTLGRVPSKCYEAGSGVGCGQAPPRRSSVEQ